MCILTVLQARNLRTASSIAGRRWPKRSRLSYERCSILESATSILEASIVVWCMRWKQIGTMTCSIARTLSVVGDRWTMLIVGDVCLGIRRFEGIHQDLRLTPHRLSDRLRKLVLGGIFRCVAYEKHPPRFEHWLTEKGLDLYPLIVAMIEWGDRWMAGRAGVPVELVHRPCGHSFKPELICPSCKSKIAVCDMSARRRPALKGRAVPGQRKHPQPRPPLGDKQERCDDQKVQL
jgi:DNA-binding HxlR family transcriptional regulator